MYRTSSGSAVALGEPFVEGRVEIGSSASRAIWSSSSGRSAASASISTCSRPHFARHFVARLSPGLIGESGNSNSSTCSKVKRDADQPQVDVGEFADDVRLELARQADRHLPAGRIEVGEIQNPQRPAIIGGAAR